MSSRLQLDMRNLSLGRRHLVNAYEVEVGICVIAGKTVWSMPERLECEVLQKARYINTLTFTLPWCYMRVTSRPITGRVRTLVQFTLYQFAISQFANYQSPTSIVEQYNIIAKFGTLFFNEPSSLSPVEISIRRSGQLRCSFVANLLQYLSAKNYRNTMRFDKVTAKKQKGHFLPHSVQDQYIPTPDMPLDYTYNRQVSHFSVSLLSYTHTQMPLCHAAVHRSNMYIYTDSLGNFLENGFAYKRL